MKHLIKYLFFLLPIFGVAQVRTVTTPGTTSGDYIKSTGTSTVDDALLRDSSGTITTGTNRFLVKTLQIKDGNEANGKVLASDVNGDAAWQSISALPGGQTENLDWRFSTSTAAADPGTGYFRANNSSPPAITQLYLDDLCSLSGLDVSNIFSTIHGYWAIYFQDTDDATKFVFFTTTVDDWTDNAGWWTLPVTFSQVGAGGLPGNNQRCTFLFINKNATPSAEGNTGALTFGGTTIASATTVNLGACTGWIVDNETNPGNPRSWYIDYPGELNKTVTTIGSGIITYTLLDTTGTIVFQNTFPTSAERKSHIWLNKLSHPNSVSLALKLDEIDFITSPLAQFRDLFQAINYINDGIVVSANGANLNINSSAGNVHGDGINFVTDNTIPNELDVVAQTPAQFIYRNQTGGVSGFVTLIDPTNYDNAGTTTLIGGGTNRSTIQYVFYVPGIGFGIQRGQTIYTTLAEAVAAIRTENFVIFPNFDGNSILVGVIAMRHTATNLSDQAFARFFKADKFGQTIGAAGGSSVSTMQQTYNNSGAVSPQIVTSTANDGIKIQCGSAANTDTVLAIKNIAGSTTFSALANGGLKSATQLTAPLWIGGTGAASNAEIRATSGVGVGSEYIKFTGGTNGGTEWGRFSNSVLVIGGTTPSTPSSYKLDIQGSINAGLGMVIKNSNSGTAAYSQYAATNNGIGSFQFGVSGTGVTAYGTLLADMGFIYGNKSINFMADNVSGYINFATGGSTERMRIDASGNVGIGTTTVSAKLHSLSTTEQLRVGYDASNYYSTTVGSTGAVTFNAVGAGSAFSFSDKVTVTNPLKLQGYTVGTLPAGVVGDIAYVTDALAPTWGALAVGGGAVVITVFYNGTQWITQ